MANARRIAGRSRSREPRRARRSACGRRAAHPARQLYDLRHSRSGEARRMAARRSRSPAGSRSIAFRSWPRPARRFVSIGALTHSAPAADLSFELGSPTMRRADALRERGLTCGSTCAGSVGPVDDGCGGGAGRRRRRARRGGRRRRADGRPRPAGTTWASPPGAGLYFSSSQLARPSAAVASHAVPADPRGRRRRA